MPIFAKFRGAIAEYGIRDMEFEESEYMTLEEMERRLLPPTTQTDAAKIHAELNRVEVGGVRYWELVESLAVQWFPVEKIAITVIPAIAPTESAPKKRGRKKKV